MPTLIALCVVTLLLVVLIVPYARERIRRHGCYSHLRCIGMAMYMYSIDHDGAFPTNIRDMTNYANHSKLYVCPSSGTEVMPPYSIAHATNWFDYIYITWSRDKKTPDNYPRMYDRLLAHHKTGIFILKAGGDVVWDKNAEWLQKFAKEHPTLKIPMPGDIGTKTNQ